MGSAIQLQINQTYRNAQEVIDIAGNFVQENKKQIKKTLRSNKSIKDPVIIYSYNGDVKKTTAPNKEGHDYQMAMAVQTALEKIIETSKQEGQDAFKKKILLIGRFGFDGQRLGLTGIFRFKPFGDKLENYKYPKLDITFMTAHASKGLTYDDVIIINCKNEKYGFPSKVESDPIMQMVIKEDKSYDYAEERRLFYVAMTRTKNRVYMIAPESNPSEFLLEIKKKYKNVVLDGFLNEKPVLANVTKPCPICGFPLQYRFKRAYGLNL